MKNNQIKIITPFYNPGDFLEQCVSSIITQKYDNFQVIFIDDCSTDGSFEKLPRNYDKSIIIKNNIRKTALENIHDAIVNYCEPDDIVVLVDGDDHLPNKNVLSYINDYYNQNDCWVMYGQAIWSTGQKGFATKYTKEEFDNLRKSPFKVSHIRTFRAGVYQKIVEQDPDYSCMKDKSGQFYKMTYDVAIMFPIMEMSGYDRVHYNDKPLYVYNFSNPISDHRVNQQMQWDIHREISQKNKFSKINSLY